MPQTDISLGDCSYLDTCRQIHQCKFVHYAIDEENNSETNLKSSQEEILKQNNILNGLKEEDVQFNNNIDLVEKYFDQDENYNTTNNTLNSNTTNVNNINNVNNVNNNNINNNNNNNNINNLQKSSFEILNKSVYFCDIHENINQNTSTFRQQEGEWINCDVREFDLHSIGKFGVVMADPPWDIHMNVSHSFSSNLFFFFFLKKRTKNKLASLWHNE